jgi:mannose-6-phosphate isomerase-like protein (cupin superfamily)
MSNNSTAIPKLLTATWADHDKNGNLIVDDGERPIKMRNSDGTGSPLFSFQGFGADIIRFSANEGVMNHTHEGDHILFVIAGSGVVEYNGIEYPLYPGLSYLIPGEVDHAIRAKENLVLIAVGNNHRPLDSEERMTPIFK